MTQLAGDRPALLAGDARIEFVPADEHRPGIVAVAVDVDDVDAVAKRARQAGVHVEQSGDTTLVELTGAQIELTQDDGRPANTTRSPVRIHHLVVAVASERAAIGLWQAAFGFVPLPEGPEGRTFDHHVPAGSAWFGLTSTGTNANALRKFLHRRGEGYFALSLVVPDRAEAVALARSQKRQILGNDESAQVWVHPHSLEGVLLELAAEWPKGILRPPPPPEHGPPPAVNLKVRSI